MAAPDAAHIDKPRRRRSPQTDTLLVRCGDWEPPHFRLHSCGLGVGHVEEPAEHLDWGIAQPTGQIRLIVRGTLELWLDGTAYRLGPGDAFCPEKPSRDVRLHIAQGPLEYAWVQVVGETALSLMRHVRGQVGLAPRLAVGGPTHKAIRRLVRLVQRDARRDAFAWSRETHDLLLTWWREALIGEEHRRRTASLVNDRAPLPLNLPERVPVPHSSKILHAPPRTVQDLAERLGYSRSHLTKVVSETWHETPGKTLRRDRMQQAAELLRQGKSVKEVATTCGYAAHQSFARAYRRHFGHLPSADRRK
jgi:AraC-like DNA-binding protein